MSLIRRMAAFLVLCAGLASLVDATWSPTRSAAYAGLPPSAVPTSVLGYVSLGDKQLDPVLRSALASAEVVFRDYANKDQAIEFLAIGGTDRSVLHDPRSCLFGAGWRFDDVQADQLPGTGISAESCHAIGPTSYDIIYVYLVNGKAISSVTQIRLAMLESALLGRKNVPVLFLRFVMPLNDDPAKQSSDHRQLELFAASMWTAIRNSAHNGKAA